MARDDMYITSKISVGHSLEEEWSAKPPPKGEKIVQNLVSYITGLTNAELWQGFIILFF